MKVRNTQEINNDIAKTSAEADALKNRFADKEMPEEEVASLETLVSTLETLEKELTEANVSERMAAHKDRMATPTRPAPKVAASYRTTNMTAGEALSLWIGANTPEGDNSPEVGYKIRSAGLNVGSKSAKIPVNYNGLNFKNRTILSKGGALTGADYVWQSYSDKVVEYLTYFSPVLGLLDSETTADGNKRTYFIVDDTSMESEYITASSGTETSPHIRDTNLATASVILSCFDIESGVQQVSFQELRDSYVSLEDKMAKANSNSHARKMEREIMTATGNGNTGVMGLVQAASATGGTPAAWTQDVLQNALMSIPPQYRKNAIFVSNDSTKSDVVTALRDDIGRSLFGTTVAADLEFDTLFGKKYLISQYLDDDMLLVFVPEFYKLRMVSSQLFQTFHERYWPMIGYAGIASFGGAWLGPTSACKKVTLA